MPIEEPNTTERRPKLKLSEVESFISDSHRKRTYGKCKVPWSNRGWVTLYADDGAEIHAALYVLRFKEDAGKDAGKDAVLLFAPQADGYQSVLIVGGAASEYLNKRNVARFMLKPKGAGFTLEAIVEPEPVEEPEPTEAPAGEVPTDGE